MSLNIPIPIRLRFEQSISPVKLIPIVLHRNSVSKDRVLSGSIIKKVKFATTSDKITELIGSSRNFSLFINTYAIKPLAVVPKRITIEAKIIPKIITDE